MLTLIPGYLSELWMQVKLACIFYGWFSWFPGTLEAAICCRFQSAY